MSTPNGEYQLLLSRVELDPDGERDYRTVLEVTDSPAAIAALLPFVAARLGVGDAAPAQTAVAASSVSGSANEAAEGPKRGRPRKQAAPAAEPAPEPQQTAAAPAPAPETPTELPSAAPAVAAPAPAAPKTFNPFTS